jgi:hypothetical protein
MAKSLFPKLDDQITRQGTIKSVRWYKDNLSSLFGKVSSKDLMKNTDRLTTKIEPGRMYMFYYDPKLKEKLPFYDTFPLVLPFKGLPDGFIGLNFHYLPYMARTALLNALLEFSTNSKMNESTRIAASWTVLQNASTSKYVQPAVKRYLYNHVKSRFLSVHADEWATAIMLPVETFEKASKQQVWNDSKKKMG